MAETRVAMESELLDADWLSCIKAGFDLIQKFRISIPEGTNSDSDSAATLRSAQSSPSLVCHPPVRA
jgi:hypothetical protein